MNGAGYILYIELVALGTFCAVNVEPMNVYRIAVMKTASRVIVVHNHPSGRLDPSEADLDVTDRLIQVGHILNIELLDHLIITPVAYLGFRQEGLMDELKKSLKYVPTYQILEQVRAEEKKITREKLALEKSKTKTVRGHALPVRRAGQPDPALAQRRGLPLHLGPVRPAHARRGRASRSQLHLRCAGPQTLEAQPGALPGAPRGGAALEPQRAREAQPRTAVRPHAVRLGWRHAGVGEPDC
ncbi:JAB domain-containing protein [Paraburkholderia hayleyella]|uniref:JAB domain-containing protein n=1 Tax=Paraburkholderia hayleyella TaxID=2152889 RepID=UPI001FE3EFFE|nr:JAB domain-containing protein [Paraburkholderia hayleyella]